ECESPPDLVSAARQRRAGEVGQRPGDGEHTARADDQGPRIREGYARGGGKGLATLDRETGVGGVRGEGREGVLVGLVHDLRRGTVQNDRGCVRDDNGARELEGTADDVCPAAEGASVEVG